MVSVSGLDQSWAFHVVPEQPKTTELLKLSLLHPPMLEVHQRDPEQGQLMSDHPKTRASDHVPKMNETHRPSTLHAVLNTMKH